jgi:hypothetical protein
MSSQRHGSLPPVQSLHTWNNPRTSNVQGQQIILSNVRGILFVGLGHHQLKFTLAGGSVIFILGVVEGIISELKRFDLAGLLLK